MPDSEEFLEVVGEESVSKLESGARVRSPLYSSAYVNSAQIGSTPFEFRLTLSEMRELEPGTLGMEEKITLVMSPQHIKVMVMLISQNLKRWEEANGAIRIPGGMLAPDELQKLPRR